MDVLRYLFREYLKKEIYGQVFYKKMFTVSIFLIK